MVLPGTLPTPPTTTSPTSPAAWHPMTSTRLFSCTEIPLQWVVHPVCLQIPSIPCHAVGVAKDGACRDAAVSEANRRNEVLQSFGFRLEEKLLRIALLGDDTAFEI